MKRIDRLGVLVFFALVLLAGVIAFWVHGLTDAKHVATVAESSEAAAKDFQLPTVEGLGSVLEGWTFTNNWGVDDWRVDTILQAHGGHEADSGEIPDIRLESTSKNDEPVLWVQYRGRDRFVGKSDPEFHTQFTKVLIDMARLRLAELREEISRKEGV